MPFTPPEIPEGWLTYANADYGFTFRYPSNWVLDNRWTHCAQFWQGDLFLDFCFRHPDEQADYLRPGLPAGDIQPGGHISFFGQSLHRQVLVYEGKIKVVLYQEVLRGGVIFNLSLDDFSLDYDAVDLSAETQQLVDQIIESFAWIPVPPP